MRGSMVEMTIRQATNEYIPPLLNSVDAVIHMQESPPPQGRFLVGCSSPFMRLAEHLTALRDWCKQQYLPGR